MVSRRSVLRSVIVLVSSGSAAIMLGMAGVSRAAGITWAIASRASRADSMMIWSWHSTVVMIRS